MYLVSILMSDLKYSTLFVELDCLFDTRIATIASMNEDLLDPILQYEYHKRADDNFPIPNLQEYQERYAKRDKRILAKAMITPIAFLLGEYAEKTLKQILTTPFHYKPKIVINVYPYKLTEEEINIIISSVANITKKLADIEVVDMTYEQLTPSWVRSNVTTMVMYDYGKWLDVHVDTGEFEKRACPEITLLAPRIYFVPHSTVNDEHFREVEKYVQTLIGLRLLSIDNFSMVFKKELYG